MIKDIIEANESITPNQKEMEILHEYFPSCFHTDGSFDLTVVSKTTRFYNSKIPQNIDLLEVCK